MNDFFSSLIFRSLGASGQVAPRHAARFEAELQAPAETDLTEIVDEVETYPKTPGDLGAALVRRPPPTEQGTPESGPATQGSDQTTPSTAERQHLAARSNKAQDEQLPVHLSGSAAPATRQPAGLTPGSPPNGTTKPASTSGASDSTQRPSEEWAGKLPYRSDIGAGNGRGAPPKAPRSSTGPEPHATPEMAAARTSTAALAAQRTGRPPKLQRQHAAPTSFPQANDADHSPKETAETETSNTSSLRAPARRAGAIDRSDAGLEPREHTAMMQAVIRPRAELAVERDTPSVSEQRWPNTGPTIEVTIGRVEVRGYANTPAATRPQPAVQPGVLPLAEYLARRRGAR